MNYQIMICMLIISTCEAYKVKVRNHTDQDINVIVDTVVGRDIHRKIKANKREILDTKGWTWRGIRVETEDGKRKGSAGPIYNGCDPVEPTKVFIFKKNGKELEYLAGCKKDKMGTAFGEFFDVFTPSQGKYRTKQKIGYKEELIKDTGDNLIVVNRFSKIKY